ncbi:uncharacterized protein [Triticum aestivum]|nr:uncharacterized protein LOC123124878 [Triticum aestivum]
MFPRREAPSKPARARARQFHRSHKARTGDRSVGPAFPPGLPASGNLPRSRLSSQVPAVVRPPFQLLSLLLARQPGTIYPEPSGSANSIQHAATILISETIKKQAPRQQEQRKQAQTKDMDMEMTSSSAPAASYFNFSVAQAVVTISINVILVWLSALVKSSTSSSSSASRRSAAPAPEPEPAQPAPASGASEVDLDVVLGVMGAGGAASVGFEEAAALFEEEEATVEEAAAAFRVFDRNGDGFVDAGELGSVLRSLGFTAGVAAAECQRMIDAYDENKDGRMDFQEFLNFMERSSS